MVALSPLLTVATIVIAALAFREAQVKGRIILAVIMISTFLLPVIVPSNITYILAFVGRILTAVVCLIYLKWQGGIFSR